MSYSPLDTGPANGRQCGGGGVAAPDCDATDPFDMFRDDLERKLVDLEGSLGGYRRVVFESDTAVNGSELKRARKQFKRHAKASQAVLRDLESAVAAVCADRHAFPHISDAELISRERSVADARARIDAAAEGGAGGAECAEKVAADARALVARRADPGARTRMAADTLRSSGGFENGVGDDLQLRATAQLRLQDDTLDELSGMADRVGELAGGIREEVDGQNRMLDGLADDLDSAEELMGTVLGKVGALLQTRNKCQIGTILGLFLVIVVLLILVLNT
eukprot:CAMPEP_0194289386 /NCGR_PEP_ID=MMETSP0169-20130528/38956_1 /TAXON_ID=218684 /ORGANISM="Corethron pennatum, Strain L29A3" /LENGTH=278 /DNA_ID=CAMNT_0039036651 /DNA_START=66 /DNA_END=902 /DNA_ORIENTATION=+